MTSSDTIWELVSHRDTDRSYKDTWTFRTTVSIIDIVNSDKNNIQVFHNGSVDQANYANGCYPTAQARTMWDQLMDKGYGRQVV